MNQAITSLTFCAKQEQHDDGLKLFMGDWTHSNATVQRPGFVMRILFVFVITLTALLSGCAKRADSIAPVQIPIAAYSNLECEALTQEYLLEYEKLNQLAKQQNQAATGDAVGVFLIGVPTASVTGHDKEGELAVAKGKVLSIENTMKSKSCDVPQSGATNSG